MRVVIPHTTIGDGVLEAVQGSWHELIELRDVSGSDESYWELLNELWGAGETFAIVEQDIVVGSSTLVTMAQCSRDWCAAPYPYFGGVPYMGLGCVKFTTAMMRQEPDLMTYAADVIYPGHDRKHWCTLDATIQRRLTTLGYPVHQHGGVHHQHLWPTHGCC